jgi:hypothetical protein
MLRITLAIFAVLFALTWWRYSPPAPVAADAPADRFSATRARAVQEKLVGDGATRFVGTEGNRRGREAMIAELGKAGWTVETQEAMTCTHYGLCVPVANVVAHLDGTDPALPGVLMSAHHDSVGAGPGASDDGLGVATIVESARAISAGKRPKRTIVALLTDGEESGLVGADAFVRSHPLAGKVRATVNVDARGSSGPSSMFETSRGNAWLASLMGEHLERPVTTSLFYEVYRRMPNDTDFSITKTIASGVNFANIRQIEHYHTPLDDLAHSDLGTLQHHGDHVLGMTRAFADGEIAARSDQIGDAVWFDVLAFGIVRWPENWSILLAIIAFAFVLRHVIRARAFDRGLAVFPAALAVGGAGGFVAATLLSMLGAVPSPWVAQPRPGILAIELGALAGALGAIRLLAITPRALWAGTWLFWALLGIVTSKLAPGASYLFIVPAIAAGIAGQARFEVACVAPAAVAATLTLTLRDGLYDALGFAVAPLLAIPVILLATTLAPMLVPTDKRIPIGGAALSVIGLLAAAIVPKYTAEHPQRVNVAFRQDEAGAKVLVDTSWGPAMQWGEPPEAMLRAAGAGEQRVAALPWMRPAPYADVPPLAVERPSFELTSATDENGTRKIRGKLRSARQAPIVVLWFPLDRHVEVKVNHRYAYPRTFATGRLLAVAATESELEIDASGTGPLNVEVADRTFGVPPGTKAEAAVKARPPAAVAFQDGDITVVSRKLSL